MEINQKSRGPLIVPDQITEKDIDHVGVDRNDGMNSSHEAIIRYIIKRTTLYRAAGHGPGGKQG